MLLDLSSGVPDKAWLGKQKTIHNYVEPRNDSGIDQFAIGRGEGRTGGDCLVVTSPANEAGLPGLWIVRGRGNGRGSVANVKTNEGYMATGPANRLSFWLRFDDGFRAKSSAATKLTNNLHVGTYHFDPTLRGDRKESNNWHFYHMLVLRHDKARDGWIHVVLNSVPQHQRSRNGYQPPLNPTQEAGSYWELLTRFYIDPTPYFADAEIDYPVRMWIDDIQLMHVAEKTAVDLSLAADRAVVKKQETTTFPVVVANRTDSPMSGVVGARSFYGWRPRLTDESTGTNMQGQVLALAPRETKTLSFSVTPDAVMKSGTSLLHGIIFSPDSERQPNYRSLSDPNVEVRESQYGISGPCDGNPSGATIRLSIA